MRNNTKKNHLCVLIPTYNRSESVEYYLEQKINLFQELHFDVVIYDSSENDLTKNIVIKYQEKGFECLKYVYYKDPAGDMYGNKKVAHALTECADIYEYVWLCGDQAILLLEEYQDELMILLKEGYDVIHIYPNKEGIASQKDMDYKVLFEHFFWSMTHWCAFLLSKRLIKEMESWLKKYIEMNFVTYAVFAVYAALTREDFKIAYLNYTVYKHSPFRTLAVSVGKKDMLRGFAEMIDVGVSNLPEEYEPMKDTAKKSFSKYTGTFSRQGAVNLRADGNLTLMKLMRYKKHLRQVTEVPLWWFYLWTLIPRGIAKKSSVSYTVYIKGAEKLHKLSEDGNRIILYGIGEHGSWIYEKIKYIYHGIKVAAISDKNWAKATAECRAIPPTDICKEEFDYVGVAIVNKEVYQEIKKELIRLGVPTNKILHI